MIGVQYLNICINNINIKSIGIKNVTKYNIIDSVLVSSVPGEVQHYCNYGNFKYLVSDNLIDFVNITILDQDYNLVNFNNIDWFISIKFEFMYKKQFIMPGNYISDNGYNENQMYYAYLEEERHQLLKQIKNNNFKNQ